ncbi:DMT family transporter [Verrucomicrobium sp. BvORR106]|uniref:DMT family transporter n=1 Tax=Verrucomicrobium sp. BvORR106 TaxID=1403819 RepID=UPI00056F9F0E|nr:DMT family transporter [Verrucomicrobium sp. BvORR106]
MNFDRQAWAAFGSTSLFVLLWSSGAIFSRLGLEHASPFVFLLLRFALALGVLLIVSACRGRWLPQPGTRRRAGAAGLLMIGGYAACYLLALAHGVTPGVLATVLGVQPLLTLILLERTGFSGMRVIGLLLAFAGLTLVVSQGWHAASLSRTGLLYALGALVSITAGSILQKGIQQAPLEVLPLQYGCSLVLCAAVLPFQPVRVEFTPQLWVALLWLSLVISIGAQLLLFRLIQRGSLVNVTSLFYLVPAMTALLDFLILGNRMPMRAVAGLAAILVALVLVFRAPSLASKPANKGLSRRRMEDA